MKLSRGVLTISCLTAFAAGAAFYLGCSSSTTPAGNTGSPGGPPSKPVGAKAADTSTERTFAVQKVFLGDTDQAGNRDTMNGWKHFGYNLDGKVTTVSSTDVCKPIEGATNGNQVDGDQGIDNNFGHLIVDNFIDGLSANPSKTANDAIAGGQFTLLLSIKGLTDDAAQNAVGLNSHLNVGLSITPDGGTPPTFTKSDDWPVFADLLTDPKNPDTSKVSFSDSFMNAGTFSTGTPGDVDISLTFKGVSLALTLHGAVVTFKHSSASAATGGILAGVLTTTDLVTEIQKIAPQLTSSACSPGGLDTIFKRLKQASDMIVGGAQDPTKDCDGISLGIGFSAAEVANPTKSTTVDQTPTNPCAADAGTGADGG